MQLTAAKSIFLAMVLIHSYAGSYAGVSIAEADSSAQEFQTITAFSYHAGPGDSLKTDHALALYGAKPKGVLLAAKQLAGRGLLEDYGDEQMAVFCLVADELRSSIIDESFSEKSNTYTTSIKSRVSLNDFVKAEIKNAALEKKETHSSLKDEMEPVVSATIDPAQELSRAYRYLGKQHWRMAIIYLDGLEKKYPHWDALFLAKSMGFQGMQETKRAQEALSSACKLGNQEACIKIRAADQVK